MNYDTESISNFLPLGQRRWGWGRGEKALGGVGMGMDTETKTVCQTVKRGKIQKYKIRNHIHNVEHVEQSSFLNICE